MVKERKRASIPVRSVEGKTTFGKLLHRQYRRMMEEHLDLFNTVRTKNVSRYREKFTTLLSTELTPEEALVLGEKRKEYEKRLKWLTGLIRHWKYTKGIRNYQMLEKVITEYEKMLKEIKQGRK